MPPLQSTEDLYRNTRRQALGAMLLARSEWSKINPNGDWLAQWQARLVRFAPVVYAAQVGAATDGSAAVGFALAESGHPEPKLGTIQPKAFAGWVSPSWTGEDGLLLPGYLAGAVSSARNATGSPREMLAVGGKVLESLVQYAVVDASAHAHDAQLVATRNTYSVFTEPGSMCQRCAVLVGKRYKPETHVHRHPNCDGVMEARSESDSFEPEAPVLSRVKDLTTAQQKAIDEGADLNQIINSKRNKSIGIYTLEGTTRRGFAHFAITTRHGAYKKSMDRKRPGARYASTTIGRLTPEAIYKVAKDRTDMIRLLRIYGYILR